MNKKFLSLLVITSLSIILLNLTGCGNTVKEAEVAGNNSNENITNEEIAVNDDIYTDENNTNKMNLEGKYIVSFDDSELIQEYGNAMNIELDSNGGVIYTNIYADQTKTGTYTVDNDTININYTYVKVFDQSLDKMVERSISENDSFKVENDTTIIQISTGYKFIKQ